MLNINTMDIFNQHIGTGPKDFEVLDNLPPSYEQYINGLISKSNVVVHSIPYTSPYYDDSFHIKISIGDKPTDLLMAMQGGLDSSAQHLYYNSLLFMFTMIPMSREQQIIFVNKLFREHFVPIIEDEMVHSLPLFKTNFNLSKRHIETRPILNL